MANCGPLVEQQSGEKQQSVMTERFVVGRFRVSIRDPILATLADVFAV
jgi:hypothetical protein